MLQFTLRWLARRPLATVHRLGAALGRLAYLASGSYRRKVVGNLRAARLDSARMRRAAARHAGMLAAESAHVWLHPLADTVARVDIVDWAPVERAQQAGRGIVFLTPHLGAFEVTARCYALRAPITVLYKPPRRADLRELIESRRAHANLHTAPATLAGVRALLRALRRGEAVGILPDQVPDGGEGDWAPFFDRPAYTMTLPERLVRASGAAVILAVGERLPGRGWRLHLEPLDEPPAPAAINAAMERLIRRFPEQYLWGYNRYRRPRARAQQPRLHEPHPQGEPPRSEGPSRPEGPSRSGEPPR